jgi:hypothetical protein
LLSFWEVGVKRSALAAAVSAAVLFASLPGVALAKPEFVPGVFDQGVAGTPVDGGMGFYWSNSAGLTQTITPGHSGILTHVEMDCVADGGSMPVILRVGASSATGLCSDGNWYSDFIFSAPMPGVVAGTPFPMSIDTGGFGIGFGYSILPYAGGRAADGGEAIEVGEPAVPLTSFAFMSYVLEPPTTTYAWNPTSVQPGISTPVALTAVTVFPVAYEEPNVIPAAGPNAVAYPMTYTVTLGSLPAWFTPTGIECSAEVTNCALANLSAGLTATGTGAALTVSVTVSGTAAPPTSAAGSSGQAAGNGCNSWTLGNSTITSCGNAQASLAVAAAEATAAPIATPLPTLPASTTGGKSGTSDGSAWPVLAVLFGLASAALFAGRRETQPGRK